MTTTHEPMTWAPEPSSARSGRVHMFIREQGHGYRQSLDDILGLDTCPVEVLTDGRLAARPELTVPDVYGECDDAGESYVHGVEDAAARDLARQGWEPMRGHTGQHGATSESWFMHQSEFIGGGMAEHILAEPGIYAAVVVYPIAGEGVDVEPTEWALLRREPTA